MTARRHQAILLVGPTGAGKTPLGQLLAERGHQGTRCVHFDFGENLRRVVDRNRPDAVVTEPDIHFLKDVLRTGALLEDGDFPIARRILLSFFDDAQVAPDTWVVLNGLPRHVGQARSLAAVLEVRKVVLLDCAPEDVVQRITSNLGGDRTDRTDDDLEAVRRKLATYGQRTKPLLDYYRNQGAVIIQLGVTADTTTDQMWSSL